VKIALVVDLFAGPGALLVRAPPRPVAAEKAPTSRKSQEVEHPAAAIQWERVMRKIDSVFGKTT
jgi:hypothetical protein